MSLAARFFFATCRGDAFASVAPMPNFEHSYSLSGAALSLSLVFPVLSPPIPGPSQHQRPSDSPSPLSPQSADPSFAALLPVSTLLLLLLLLLLHNRHQTLPFLPQNHYITTSATPSSHNAYKHQETHVVDTAHSSSQALSASLQSRT